MSPELRMMVARGVRLPFTVALTVVGYIAVAENSSGWLFLVMTVSIYPFLAATAYIEVMTFAQSLGAWKRRSRSPTN